VGDMERLNFAEVARKAWERAPEGRSEIEGHRITRDSKMVLVTKGSRTETNIVAFPRPEHFEAFEKAIENLFVAGPSTANPGAVGTIGLKKFNQVIVARSPLYREFWTAIGRDVPGARPSFYQLVLAQAHFTTTGDQARREGRPVYQEALLPKRLYRRYSGWLQRGLRESIALAGDEKKDLLLDKQEENAARLLTGKKAAAFRAELERACRETGAQMLEGKRFVVVRPVAP